MLLGAICCVLACAHPPAATSAEGTDGSEFRDPNVITAAQLYASGLMGSTAFDVIRTMRPQFLVDSRAGNSVSTQPTMVSVNGGELHPLSYLRNIPTSTIAEIRYLREGEAGQRLGPRTAGSAVILVSLRNQR